jgi:hypothetical protein
MRKKWQNSAKFRKLREDDIEKVILDSNYEFARYFIMELDIGDKVPVEISRALDGFIENPCFHTARDLVKLCPPLIDSFKSAKKGTLSETSFAVYPERWIRKKGT